MSGGTPPFCDDRDADAPGSTRAIERGAPARCCRGSGRRHWVFELEADATIPAEYILLQHYLGTHRAGARAAHRRYLRAHPGRAWRLAAVPRRRARHQPSVKAYFALKMVGDPADAPHMARARAAILARGGARRRQRLHPHHAGPVRRGAVARGAGDAGRDHAAAALVSVSHRQGVVLVAHGDRAAAGADGAAAAGARTRAASRSPSCSSSRPTRVRDWITPPNAVADRPRSLSGSTGCCGWPSRAFRRRRASARSTRRSPLSPSGSTARTGSAAIFPAMANSLMMYDCLGYPPDHPNYADRARRDRQAAGARRRRSPIASPACRRCGTPGSPPMRCMEVGDARLAPALRRGARLARRRAGARRRRRLGGAAARTCGRAAGPSSTTTRITPMSTTPPRSALALDRFDRARYRAAIERAAEWVVGMQSQQRRLGRVRRRQHALLPEPHPVRRSRRAARPADRRCQRALPRLSGAARLRRRPSGDGQGGSTYLRREQEADGSWFGRWGTNYIYGTWSVLAALNAAGVEPEAPEMRRAVAWLLDRQREDGGWGENGASY